MQIGIAVCSYSWSRDSDLDVIYYAAWPRAARGLLTDVRWRLAALRRADLLGRNSLTLLLYVIIEDTIYIEDILDRDKKKCTANGLVVSFRT